MAANARPEYTWIFVVARMAELADAGDSKSPEGNFLWVRPPLWALQVSRQAGSIGQSAMLPAFVVRPTRPLLPVARFPLARHFRVARHPGLARVVHAHSAPLHLLHTASQFFLQAEVPHALDG